MGFMHHLATIMFVDLVGYTKLMQHDEALALGKQALHEHFLNRFQTQLMCRNCVVIF